MFKLLICILGVVHAVPIPDSGEFNYGYYQQNTNYAVPTFKTAAVQHINLQPVDVVKNVQPVQPNVYATSFLKLDDDDRFDFDDDDHRFVYAAQPQASVMTYAAQPQQAVMTYDAQPQEATEVRKSTFSNLQPIQPVQQNQPDQQAQPVTYNAASFFKVDDDDDRYDFDDNKHIFYSAFPQINAIRKSTFTNVQATPYNAPSYFKVDDDRYDFDDDEHRFVYAAQPQASVMTYAAQPQQAVMTYAAQPQPAMAYAVKHDFDNFNSEESFRSVVPAYNGGMFYSANEDRSGEFDDDDYVKTHKISKREVNVAPQQPQPAVTYHVKHDSDNINSEEVFRSMVPSNVRTTNYGGNVYASAEEDLFDDDYSKAQFLQKNEFMAAPAQPLPQVMTYEAQPQAMTYEAQPQPQAMNYFVKHDFDDFNSDE